MLLRALSPIPMYPLRTGHSPVTRPWLPISPQEVAPVDFHLATGAPDQLLTGIPTITILDGLATEEQGVI